MKWWKLLAGLVVIGGGLWFYKTITAPIPGVHFETQGQEHVSAEEVAAFTYSTNPPTSGPHLADPSKAGIYDVPQPVGALIHSLEHGHVIINYNCNVHLSSEKLKMKSAKWGITSNVYAHEEGGEASPSVVFVDPAMATQSAVNDTQACKDLIKKLSDLATKNRLWKLIVVPSPTLDATIALTAWTYIEKFDEFDAKRIETFINYHRNHGPEQTME